MRKFIVGANAMLFSTVVYLVLAVMYSTSHKAEAGPQSDPPCEDSISTVTPCPSGQITLWGVPYTECSTFQNVCCEYDAKDKWCVRANGTRTYNGYVWTFKARSDVSPCGPTAPYGGRCGGEGGP